MTLEELLAQGRLSPQGSLLPTPMPTMFPDKDAEKKGGIGDFMKGDMAQGMMVALASGLLGQPPKQKVQAQAWGNQGSARPYKPMFQGSQGGDFKSILAMLMRGR